MKGLIINHGSSYAFDLAKLFTNCDVVSYTHFTTEHANQYDYIVLSGGEINISGEQDIPVEKSFLKNINKPIFGVCLGMQILCIIEGKKLKELPTGRRILNEHLDFNGIEGEMTYHHGWYIDEIPDGYQGFIQDGIVKFIYNDKTIAFQGHPELSGDYGKTLKKFFYDNYLDNKRGTETKD